MQRQFNHSVRVGKGKGSMKLSVVLRMIQLAASQARDPAKNLRDMQRVGFFLNTASTKTRSTAGTSRTRLRPQRPSWR